ncbi:MAG: hypothetical protein VZR27_00885 [Acutalibacteraceae bacterium]|nr:hypothetical protein [Clostridia bacterium]MEE3449247.1 hypothetical protein [Acutalibacteraceae bacterium]
MKMDIKSFFRNISPDKKRMALVIMGIAGMALIFISNYMSTSDNTKATEENVLPDNFISAKEYKQQLEAELSDIISSIEGAGNVKIMITMESGTEDIYAVEKNITERRQNKNDEYLTDSETEYKEGQVYVVIKNKNGTEQAVLLKQVMPKIRGVLVVCDGGGDPVTKEKITQAVAGVLNISSGKVFVTD